MKDSNTKKHYDNHLGNFYSWMSGDFNSGKEKFLKIYRENNLTNPEVGISKVAIDIGAGHGMHSSALAELGYEVLALDFNEKLLSELKENTINQNVKAIYDDIKNLKHYDSYKPSVIVCMGDTITHFESLNEIEKILEDSFDILSEKGKFVVSFRDYSYELKDENRFIPVKSDESKILICFLEFMKDLVKVNDLYHYYENEKWNFSVSSYFKYRLSELRMTEILKNTGFKIINKFTENGMIYIFCEKQ